MKILLILFWLFNCAALGLIGCAAPTPAPLRIEALTVTPRAFDRNALARQLDRYLSCHANQQEFSGVVLIARDGEIILKKAYGFADSKKQIANTTETRFQLASVSKTLTATAIMQLVARGKINLQSPISAYLTDTPRTWQKITVAELLAHTSGIPDYFSFDEFENEMKLTPGAIVTAAKKYPLDFEARSAFEYSNTGYVLLGEIIENVSGKAYGQFLREMIFDPLHMSATGREEKNAPRAVGYVSYDVPAKMFPITNALGDGDLLSTVDDLYKFDRALYDEKILAREVREKMFTPIGKNNYGLGWEIETWNGKRVVSHSGGINGFASELMRFPDDNATIILLSNLESFDAPQTAYEIAMRLFP